MKGFSGFGSPLKKDEKPRKGVLKGNMPKQTPNKPPKGPKVPNKLPKKAGMGPLPGPRIPVAGGSKPMSDAAKAVNYLNKASRHTATFDARYMDVIEKNKSKRKFSKAARNVGRKKVGKKVIGKIASRAIPYVGAALLVKDAIGIAKQMKKGKSFKKSARKQFLGY